jgi:hypothetical protein
MYAWAVKATSLIVGEVMAVNVSDADGRSLWVIYVEFKRKGKMVLAMVDT